MFFLKWDDISVFCLHFEEKRPEKAFIVVKYSIQHTLSINHTRIMYNLCEQVLKFEIAKRGKMKMALFY